MVKGHDFHSSDSPNEDIPKKLLAAPTLDRLAAFIADLMIIIPIFKVFAFQSIQTLRLSVGFELTLTLFTSLFNIVWIMFAVLIIYQFTTYKFLKKTLGQYLFKIQVVHTKSFQPIDLFTLIQRNTLFFLSFFLIFPFFSVFLEKKGRTFYDRILNTLVVSQKKSPLRFQFDFPANKIFSASLMLVGFIFLSSISLFFMTQSFKFVSDFKNSDRICKKVSTHHLEWSKRDIHETRLEVAIALYSAGALSVECLEKEIQFEISLNNKSPEVYFAKALLSADDEDLSTKYFRQVCQINAHTPICEVVTWITYWPNSFEGEYSSNSNYKKPILYYIWSIKRSFSKGAIFRLRHALNSFFVLKGLESFYAEHLMHLSFINGRSEFIQNILKVTEHSFSKEKKLKEKYCSLVISETCEGFKDQNLCLGLDVNEIVDSHLKNMIYSCAHKPNQIFSTEPLKSKFYKKLASKEIQQVNEMNSFFKDSKESFSFRLTVLNTFLKSIKNKEYLKKNHNDWAKSSEKDYFWRVWGEKLKDKFKSTGESQRVFEIYKTLSQEYKEPVSIPLKYFPPSLNQRQPAQIEKLKSIPSQGF